MAQSWNLDPKTGDYVMSGGAPEQTDSLTIPAYIRMKTKRTQWLYAPNSDYGADFYLVKKRRTNENASSIENIAGRALQPLIDDGRSSNISITTTDVARHGLQLETQITDARGQVETLVLPQI